MWFFCPSVCWSVISKLKGTVQNKMSGGTVNRESQSPGVGHWPSKIKFHTENHIARVGTILKESLTFLPFKNILSMFERHLKSICETGQWCTQASKRRCGLPDRLQSLSKHNPTCPQHSLFYCCLIYTRNIILAQLYCQTLPCSNRPRKLSYGPNPAIVSKIDLFQLSSWSKVSFALQESPSRDSRKENDAQVTATLTWLSGHSLGWYHCY